MSEKRLILNLVTDRMLRLIENHRNYPDTFDSDDLAEYHQHYRLFKKYSKAVYGKDDTEMPETLKIKRKSRRRTKSLKS